MAQKTKIEWTDETLNWVTGCTPVSDGCKFCYAKRDWKRLQKNSKTVYFNREFGDVQCHWEKLDAEKTKQHPYNRKIPTRYFLPSMGDLFHEAVPFEFIERVIDIAVSSPQHIFQIITKRPERALEFFKQYLEKSVATFYIPENIWIGVSVEDQKTWNVRIPVLLLIPVQVKIVSMEPMLSAIDMTSISPQDAESREELLRLFPLVGEFICDGMNEPMAIEYGGISQIIVGGESGPGARPMHPQWARDVRDQCIDAKVPFFFKQWGALVPNGQEPEETIIDTENLNQYVGYMGEDFYRVGKSKAGRLLDGREWNEYPNIDHPAIPKAD